ncbi:MAG TPA: CDP-alcohol phosphatidyltransferase family protein [Bacteroidota bacterium]|nr:CDP-alcohol phosphatidyltransferase family protein [Bacteroidota bacterium]
MRHPVVTISNGLSALRVLLIIPIALYLNSPETRFVALGLILVAVATDLLDGYIARKLGEVTELGKILDPVADKLAVAFVSLILALQQRIPWWFFAIAVVRDILIFCGGVLLRRKRGVTLQSNLIGKWTVTVVAAFLVVTILNEPYLSALQTMFLFASVVMLLVSFISYAIRFRTVVLANALS